MAFEKYVLQKNNTEYPIRDVLAKKELTINEVCEVLNELNIQYNDLEDNLKQVLTKEFKTTRWRDEYYHVRTELILDIANQLNIEI